MHARMEPLTVVTRCLQAWTTGDFDTARSLLSDDVTAESPLGSTSGVDDYLEALSRLAEVSRGAEARQVVANGNDVCVRYDLMTKATGPLATTGWFHVEDGKIGSVREYFDPRALPARPVAPPSGLAPPFTLPVRVSAESEIADGDAQGR